MRTVAHPKNGDKLSVLGFGCMRYPVKNGGVDEVEAGKLLRSAYEKGVTYFDTAYIYHMGRSEAILGRALQAVRSQVKYATKLPPFLVKKISDADRIFEKQLARLRTDYIDYYLMHMLTDMDSWRRLQKLGIEQWLAQKLKEGSIRNVGFSYHGGQNAFPQILDDYPWSFCQLQYNYIDQYQQAGRQGLLYAAAKQIPVVVMEPLRGGRLVRGLAREAAALFQKTGRSPAEWALRWLWNHPEIAVVLSGMSCEADLAENARIAGEAHPGCLTAEELALVEQAASLCQARTKVNCTGCGYCLPCPAGVDIPTCLACLNESALTDTGFARKQYLRNTGAISAAPGNASRCTGCGRCEAHCPQGVPIRAKLEETKQLLEPFWFVPVSALARRFMGVKNSTRQ